MVNSSRFPRAPLNGSPPMTSPFGARIDPISGRAAGHNGVDFGVAVGTELIACADGTVIDTAQNAGADGTFFRIKADLEGGRYDYSYSHCAQLRCKEGDRVRAGDVVGLSGNSGRSTGPHLHFSVRDRGAFIDPLSLLPLALPNNEPGNTDV